MVSRCEDSLPILKAVNYDTNGVVAKGPPLPLASRLPSKLFLDNLSDIMQHPITEENYQQKLKLALGLPSEDQDPFLFCAEDLTLVKLEQRDAITVMRDFAFYLRSFCGFKVDPAEEEILRLLFLSGVDVTLSSGTPRQHIHPYLNVTGGLEQTTSRVILTPETSTSLETKLAATALRKALLDQKKQQDPTIKDIMVLCRDDDPAILEAITRFLNIEGHYPNSEEAFQIARKGQKLEFPAYFPSISNGEIITDSAPHVMGWHILRF